MTADGRDPLNETDHATLAGLVRELLLVGQLVDRAGMPALLGEFGVDGMRDVAIEEWQAASPHYTTRMKRALRITGDGVAEIFKGFQLDVGAPPEFMDFRYEVRDHDHGGFHLDHCGALVDVEPMGDDLVRTMCHDIEDPTFPATALATNPRARVEPVHRPPRRPADRTPHCAWEVVIDPAAEPARPYPPTLAVADRRAVSFAFPEPGPRPAGEPGHLDDYSGPLLADLRFADFTGDALVRIAREVYLQIHLLALGFDLAVCARTDVDTADRLLTAQCEGIAGVASERLSALLRDRGVAGAELVRATLALHPLFGPAHYTGARVGAGTGGAAAEITVDPAAAAAEDDCWARCLRPGPEGEAPAAVLAAARGVDPRAEVEVAERPGPDGPRTVLVVRLGGVEHPVAESVALTRLSTGTDFRFGPDRPLLPITPA